MKTFINLPVKGLGASIEFFTEIGSLFGERSDSWPTRQRVTPPARRGDANLP